MGSLELSLAEKWENTPWESENRKEDQMQERPTKGFYAWVK